MAEYAKKAMTNAIENFIRKPVPLFNMAKDSELVRKVESFLNEHKIDKYIIKYDRGIDFTEHKSHPAFDIQTDALNALENLSRKLKIDLKKDIYKRHKYIQIENKEYSIYLYVPFCG